MQRPRAERWADPGADVKPPEARARRAILRLGDANACGGRIARRALAVEVGLRHETTSHQCLAAIEFILGERGVGARGGDRSPNLAKILDLDRAIDRDQGLALADPAVGVDQHRGDSAAFAGDPDRLVAPRGERARRGNRARDFAAPRNHDRDRGHLPLATRTGCRGVVGGFLTEQQERGDKDCHDPDRAGNHHHPPPTLAAVDDDQLVASVDHRFAIHSVVPIVWHCITVLRQ